MNLKLLRFSLILLVGLQTVSPAWSWERPGAPPFNTNVSQTIPASPNISSVTVNLTGKGPIKGKLLHAGDSELIIWTSDSDYDRSRVFENVRKIPWTQIDSIKTNMGRDFWKGAGYGFLIGAAIGVIGPLLTPDQPNSILSREFIQIIGGLYLGLIGGAIGGLIFPPALETDIPVRQNPQAFPQLRDNLNKIAIFPDAPPGELDEILKPVRPLGPRLD